MLGHTNVLYATTNAAHQQYIVVVLHADHSCMQPQNAAHQQSSVLQLAMSKVVCNHKMRNTNNRVLTISVTVPVVCNHKMRRTNN